MNRIDTHSTNQSTNQPPEKKQTIRQPKQANKSHHQKNYLILFIRKDTAIKKALINAKDEKNALRIALNRFCRLFPFEVLTGVRVGGVYDNGKKRIEKRIG